MFRGTDRNQISTLMAIDESAAFDTVKHSILLDKLECYKVDAATREWISDYLTHRSQYVNIGNKNSVWKHLKEGVPQGSVLGPLLFTIYTNEMPETIRNPECQDPVHQDIENLFGKNCDHCGTVVCFADDSTFVYTHKKRDQTQLALSRNLAKIKDFLNSNQLVINTSKTALVESMLKQKRAKISGSSPILDAVNDKNEPIEISCKPSLRLLGMNIQNNITWKEHLISGDKAVFPSVPEETRIPQTSWQQHPPQEQNYIGQLFDN